MLVLVRSFLTPLRVYLVRFLSYTPDARFREEFSYTPDAGCSEVFLLHTLGYVWWGVSHNS